MREVFWAERVSGAKLGESFWPQNFARIVKTGWREYFGAEIIFFLVGDPGGGNHYFFTERGIWGVYTPRREFPPTERGGCELSKYYMRRGSGPSRRATL